MDVNMLNRPIKQGIVALSIGAVLAVAIFGFSSGMTTNADGKMSSCPNMGVPSLCHMNPLEHAFSLQSMLTAVPFSGIFTLLISLLLAFSIVFLAPLAWLNLSILFKSILRPPPRSAGFISRHTLQEAFARGILNSRAF